MSMRRLRRIDIANTPVRTAPTGPVVHDCGCGEPHPGTGLPLRCTVHGEQLRVVVERFQSGMGWERKAIWQEQDGLGKRGYIPSGGYVLGAITNSTPAAIERMLRVAHGMGPLNGIHTQQEESL